MDPSLAYLETRENVGNLVGTRAENSRIITSTEETNEDVRPTGSSRAASSTNYLIGVTGRDLILKSDAKASTLSSVTPNKRLVARFDRNEKL